MIHYKLFTSFIWVRLNPLISQNFCSLLFMLAISEQIHQLCTTETLQRLAKFLRIYSANSQKFPPFYCNLTSLGQALRSDGIVLALTRPGINPSGSFGWLVCSARQVSNVYRKTLPHGGNQTQMPGVIPPSHAAAKLVCCGETFFNW